MASEQSFSYIGFRESDLDIPTDYELHAMETQVQLEKMRDAMQHQLGEIMVEIVLLKKIVIVMAVIGVAVVLMIGICGYFYVTNWGFWWV
ncbi:unnamed protein product [Lactuca virosa]|uniref:Uncharacterized protein n=1 Tax=Lactuca virosa TaxID=75947 RepID=A0AAU9NI35_9ASTR|nr:unnamed protein product [Lactuca virosa]